MGEPKEPFHTSAFWERLSAEQDKRGYVLCCLPQPCSCKIHKFLPLGTSFAYATHLFVPIERSVPVPVAGLTISLTPKTPLSEWVSYHIAPCHLKGFLPDARAPGGLQLAGRDPKMGPGIAVPGGGHEKMDLGDGPRGGVVDHVPGHHRQDVLSGRAARTP